jgi:poly(3-hydroxyalkanoate) synthetase
VLDTVTYRPVNHVAAIHVPVWFRAGARDHLARPKAVRAAAARVPAETHVQELDASHIGGWVGACGGQEPAHPPGAGHAGRASAFRHAGGLGA